MRERRLGLLGGTFDPIHYGHLDAAAAAAAALELHELLLIPSHDPPHRPLNPHASPFQRFALAALAAAAHDGYRVSDLELLREGVSYTHDTLRALHAQGWMPWQLFFVIGSDAFADIASWRAFPVVLDAAHFVVIARPGTTLDSAFAPVPQLRGRAALPVRDEPIGTATRIWLVDARTRDVSSTLVRQRLAARLGIDDLVPPAVSRHILVNHLYGAVDDLHDENQRVSS